MSGICADIPPPSGPNKRISGWSTCWVAFWACRFVLAAVFLMAGVTKITGGDEFADHLLVHSSLNDRLALLVAAYLPWLELVCGACLALGWALRETALLCAIQLILLTGFTIQHGNETPCGCFLFPAEMPMESGGWPVVRNLVLLCGALLVIAQSGRGTKK